MSHLPRAIHFIADAPHFDVHWFGDSVTYAAIGKLGAGRSVDVFQLFQCGLQSSGAHIDGKHDFGTGLLAPSVEIVDTDFIGFGAVPCEISSYWALPRGPVPSSQL